MTDLSELQSRIGYTFKDESLLRQALTHPSVAHESGSRSLHNQRLEFLGDAVLSLVLSRDLFEQFPDMSEGPLTKARARMVNERALAAEARNLGLGTYLILSKGEEANGGRDRRSSLADAFEALLGALFLDGGLEAASTFTLRSFRDRIGQTIALSGQDNPKGELQELLQVGCTEAPQYELTAISGPDHDRLFECAVLHNGVELGRGRGKSKKDAESQAALEALARIRQQQAESR